MDLKSCVKSFVGFRSVEKVKYAVDDFYRRVRKCYEKEVVYARRGARRVAM